jgi:hypothetical protein
VATTAADAIPPEDITTINEIILKKKKVDFIQTDFFCFGLLGGGVPNKRSIIYGQCDAPIYWLLGKRLDFFHR